MAVNWVGWIVFEMADCWTERMAVMRVSSRAGWLTVKIDVNTAG